MIPLQPKQGQQNSNELIQLLESQGARVLVIKTNTHIFKVQFNEHDRGDAGVTQDGELAQPNTKTQQRR